MTRHPETAAPDDLGPTELDAIVAGEASPSPTAPVQGGMAYASLTVGGVTSLRSPIRTDLTV